MPIMNESPDNPLGVLQSCRTWLPASQKWLYTQVSSLPGDVTPYVVARQTDNLDRFELPNFFPFDDRTVGIGPVDWLLERLRYWKLLGMVGEHPIERLDRRRWIDYRAKLAERTGCKILHSHFGNIGWRDVEIARRADLKHVVTVYGYDVSLLPRQEPVWRERYRALFQHVDAVLCEGPHMAETVVGLGCPPEKARVHHLGVDLEAIDHRSRRRGDDEPTRVLMAASFREKKGLAYGLEALGRLHADHDLEVTLIGEANSEDRSQEEAARIWETVERHDLGPVLRHLEFQPFERLIEEMLAHDIFLSPSVTSERGDSEGGAPVTIIAAQATGMPVVSTTHADIPNVVVDGQTGLLAAERDTDGLVERLERLIEAPESWIEYGEAARDRIEREFDARKQGRRLAEIYRTLV